MTCQDLTVASQDLSVVFRELSLAENLPTETCRWPFKAYQWPVNDPSIACQWSVLSDRLVFLTVAWFSKLSVSCHWPVMSRHFSGPSGPVIGLSGYAENSNLLTVEWLSRLQSFKNLEFAYSCMVFKVLKIQKP